MTGVSLYLMCSFDVKLVKIITGIGSISWNIGALTVAGAREF